MSIFLIFCTFIAVYTVVSVFVKNRKNLHFILEIIKRFNLRMLLEVISVLTITITTSILLVVKIPWTIFGLSNFLTGGNENSNIMFTPFLASQQSDHIFINLIGILFILALVVIMPFLANAEEELFRRGRTEFKSIFNSSVLFGLLHLMMGVPIAAAIALIIPGFFFAYVYNKKYRSLQTKFVKDSIYNPEVLNIILSRKLLSSKIEGWHDNAVLESTAYHTLYNLIVVSILVLILFVLNK